MVKLDIGVMVGLHEQPEVGIRKVTDLGLRSCQVSCWDPPAWTERRFGLLAKAAADLGVEITTFWAGYSGPRVWDFIDGPRTIGLVPPQYRAGRTEDLKKAAALAAKFGLPSITTHVGFLPEDPNDPEFPGTVEALKQVAGRCAELGIEFWFETGQETPVTLLRTIQRVGTGNLGVNFDTGNLILYGKANPVDALDVIGRHVRGVHAKDGTYPTDGDHLGKETPLGEGKVNFPVFVPKLKSLGYTGSLTIEREISGPQQIEDIRKAIDLLTPLC